MAARSMANKSDIFEIIARIAKHFVPPALRPALRRKYMELVRAILDWRLQREFKRFTKSGGTWIQWYAERVDDVYRAPDDLRMDAAWMASGVNDLNAAISQGLKPHHSLCEFGCGSFRAGNHFIRYLDPGNYAANDASAKRLKYGEWCLKQILGEELLQKKAPQFFVNTDNSFDWLKGRKFDYIWCNAVTAHMPQEDIEVFFDNIKKAMHRTSVFLCTYAEADIDTYRDFKGMSHEQRVAAASEAADKANKLFVIHALEAARGQPCVEVGVKDWFHTFDFYRRIAESRGYRIEDVSHCLPPGDFAKFSMWEKLIRVTLA